ncbi:hypothetical protein H257_16181 [Aphanomyces astaci]|uniref:Uncharacterized protein n=1 Tax=Aphanomyces astaci TaxID=112090 RepID=W4FLF5_APHAT|nr:hypothetical protein H257_16181 [Aphanomyces astaci]ETV67716.1 hypothetical protein H257_16181 [Aphanomyces astaci]|eukprot:XP_009842837.1 hypothetical protein H257_16181 [Aphanomyces astaci]
MEKPSQAAGTALQPSPSKPGTTTCMKVLTLMQHMAPMLVFNAVMPLAIYKLAKPHTTKIVAVFLSGLIPMFKTLVTFFWFRKQDAISMIQLFGVLVSVIIDHHGSEEAARIQRRVGSDRGHVYDRVAVVARRRHVLPDPTHAVGQDHPRAGRALPKAGCPVHIQIHHPRHGVCSIVSSIVHVVLVLSLTVDTIMYMSNPMPLVNSPIMYWLYRYVNDKEAASGEEIVQAEAAPVDVVIVK